MAQRIDQFCAALYLKLTNVGSGLDDLKSRMDDNAEHAERQVRSHLQEVQWRLRQDRAKVTAAQAEVLDWANSRQTATGALIAEWKARRQISTLQYRVDNAERYAAAAIELAMASMSEAEQAALEAWLAWSDLNTVLAQLAPKSGG